ncbi:MAG: hypothetical protein ACE5HS_05670 [bacterium]
MVRYLLFGFLLSQSACLQDEITLKYLQDPNPEDEVTPGEPVETDTTKIFIVDRTGKRWEISHAVHKYGFVPEKFEFGLGPNAIPPILEPKMLRPGQPGYPDASSTFLVLGTSFEEDARAYSIQKLGLNEVANEKFSDVHVAVAY